MKPQRLSSKNYDELLKTMRRWPQPYLGIVAKLISHLGWQFNEIKRLDDRLKKLEQTGLMEETKQPEMIELKISGDYLQLQRTLPGWKEPKLISTPAERIKYIHDTYGPESKEWLRMLKVKGLKADDALKLMETV